MLYSIFLGIGGLGGVEVLLMVALLLFGLIWLLRRAFRPNPTVLQRGALPPFIADELRKLQELRDQGALTAQEYEVQKSRLLR